MPKYKLSLKGNELIIRARLASYERISERELDFFNHKNIDGMFKAQYVKGVLISGIEYSGAAAISLSERLRKNITMYDFFFIVEQIVNVVRNMKNNALKVNNIVWNMDYIFINETTREMQFMYMPIDGIAANVDINSFIENIVYTAKFSQSENTNYISEFIYFIKCLKKFDVDKIEAYIRQKDSRIVDTITNNAIESQPVIRKDIEENTTSDMSKQPIHVEEEMTDRLDDYEGTILIEDDEYDHFPSLCRVNTDETISINKSVFRLGRERNCADYPVLDNKAISRAHADIITRGEKYYILDLNSKNKTYVNGKMIQAQEEIEIRNGDRVSLANEEFIFYD